MQTYRRFCLTCHRPHLNLFDSRIMQSYLCLVMACTTYTLVRWYLISQCLFIQNSHRTALAPPRQCSSCYRFKLISCFLLVLSVLLLKINSIVYFHHIHSTYGFRHFITRIMYQQYFWLNFPIKHSPGVYVFLSKIDLTSSRVTSWWDLFHNISFLRRKLKVCWLAAVHSTRLQSQFT